MLTLSFIFSETWITGTCQNSQWSLPVAPKGCPMIITIPLALIFCKFCILSFQMRLSIKKTSIIMGHKTILKKIKFLYHLINAWKHTLNTINSKHTCACAWKSTSSHGYNDSSCALFFPYKWQLHKHNLSNNWCA